MPSPAGCRRGFCFSAPGPTVKGVFRRNLLGSAPARLFLPGLLACGLGCRAPALAAIEPLPDATVGQAPPPVSRPPGASPGTATPAGAAGPRTAGLLARGTLAERQAALAALGELDDPAADALLAEALDGLMKGDLPKELALDVVLAAGRRTAPDVKARLAAYRAAKPAQDHLAPHREALFGGDAERGRKVFYSGTTVACTRCHQIGADGGGPSGPRLDGVAARLTREELLESIVAPNRRITEGYATETVMLKDGTLLGGVVRSETAEALVLHLTGEEEGERTVPKAEVELREPGLSGMPEGLADILTPFELRDVVAFLGTLK